MKKLVLPFLLSALLFTFSCGKEETENPVDFKKEYFPVEQGLVIEYQVDSITWNDFSLPVKVDSFHYRIRLKIDTSFYDNSNRLSFRYLKSVFNDSLGWQTFQINSLTNTASSIELLENNTRYIKLVWPVQSGKTWNVNALNSETKKEATLIDVDAPMVIGGKSFNLCAISLIEEDINLIKNDFEQEIFAKNVGMVKKEISHYETKTNGAIQRGYKYSYTYINHWKE